MDDIKEKLKESEKNYIVEARLVKINNKLEAIEGKLVKNTRIGNLEITLDAIDAKFEEKFTKTDSMEVNFDAFNKKFENSLKANSEILEKILKLLELQEKNREVTVESLNAKFSKTEEEMAKLTDRCGTAIE